MRQALASALVGFAAILLLAAMVAVWANHLLLSPSNWETASTRLLANRAIRTSTATYLADQVDARLERSGLSGSDLGAAVGSSPADQRATIFHAVYTALGRAPVRKLWAQANREVATAVATIVEGPPEAVTTAAAVSINLGPTLRTAVIDADLPVAVTDAVPADDMLTVVRSQQAHTVRTAGRAIRDLARWLVIVVPALWLAAVAFGRGARRRTLAWIGITAALDAALVLAARALLITPVADAVSANPLLRHIIAASSTTVTGSLGRTAVYVGVGGLVLAGLAGLSGLRPGGSPRSATHGFRADRSGED